MYKTTLRRLVVANVIITTHQIILSTTQHHVYPNKKEEKKKRKKKKKKNPIKKKGPFSISHFLFLGSFNAHRPLSVPNFSESTWPRLHLLACSTHHFVLDD